MIDNNSVNQKKNLKLLRALDGIILGGSILTVIIMLQIWLPPPPLFLLKFVYILPLFVICRSIYQIPRNMYNSEEWGPVLRRLRFFAFMMTALSPFWEWWLESKDNLYLRVNLFLLILSAILCIYNLVTLYIVSEKSQNNRFMNIFSRLTRVAIIYIMLTPFITFAFTVWYIENSTWSIISLCFKYRDIILPIGISPIFMTAFILMRWRKIS